MVGELRFWNSLCFHFGEDDGKRFRNLRQDRENHSREYRALVFDGIWFKERKQKREVEL
jgi:hypothetical protein